MYMNTNHNPSISIIVPVFNVRDYIVRCLESIGMQTYSGYIECIVIDDCGNDDGMELAERFIASYHGHVIFRIIHLEKNKGQSGARNAGIEQAKGKFIAFVDSDDWIEPSMYEELSQRLQKDLNALFITSSIFAEFPNHSEKGYANTDDYIEGESMSVYEFLQQILSCKTNYSLWNKLYRREFIINLFREGMLSEDYLFFYDNSKAFIESEKHILTTPEAFYHYEIRKGSAMNQEILSPKQWYLDYLVAMTLIMDDCKATFSELYNIQLQRFSTVYSTFFYSIVKNKKLTTLRADSLQKLNKYVKLMDTSRFSWMTRFDMYCASSFANGYSIVRKISTIRTNLKSLIKR